jgi:AI-2 transport protein TqsA
MGEMIEKTPERTTNRLLVVIVLFLGVAALKLASPVFILLLLTVLLTYLIDPLVVVLKNKLRLPLWLALALAVAIIAAVLGGIVLLFVFELPRFARSFPRFQEEIFTRAGVMLDGVERSLGVTFAADPFEELRTAPLRPLLGRLGRSSLRILSEFILVFFLAIILLLGKYRMIRMILTVFPRRHSLVPIMLKHIDHHMRAYLGIKALASLVIGIGTTLILLGFKVEFAVTWGFLTMLLNFVPTIGPLSAIALPTAMAFVQYPGLMPLAVVASLGVLHVGISNYIEPRFLGERLDLSFFVIFVSLFFWGWLWGAAGVFLAVPVTVSIKIILERVPATANVARLLGRTSRRHPRRQGK